MPPLNIICILTSQHRQDMSGCYGDPLVKTPNIDALAKAGMRFTNAFASCAESCSSRASLFTGLFPVTHGVVDNCRRSLAPGIKTLPQYVPTYDYYHFGKWDVDSSKLPSACGSKGHDFAGDGYPGGGGVYTNVRYGAPLSHGNPYAAWLKAKGYPRPEMRHAMYGNNPHLQNQELEGYLAGKFEHTFEHFVIDDAICKLNQRSAGARPFFMWLNFWGPHFPCLLPEPYYSMYKPKSIPEHPAFRDGLRGKPLHMTHISKMLGVHDFDWSEWQSVISRYYGYITMLDDCIGLLLEYLKRTGLYDRTVIVMSADHGDAMGACRMIGTGEFMYDVAYRIPLIVRLPNPPQRGAICEDLVYLQDICPTVVEIGAGAAADLQPHAQSLLPLLTGTGEWIPRDFIYGECTRHFCPYPQRMIRTPQWKYIFNAAAEGELYDLERDPHELHNRAADPAVRDIKHALIHLLLGQMETLNDPLAEWLRPIQDV